MQIFAIEMNTNFCGINFLNLLPLGYIFRTKFYDFKVKPQKIVLQKLNLQHLITAKIYAAKVILVTERRSNGKNSARVNG